MVFLQFEHMTNSLPFLINNVWPHLEQFVNNKKVRSSSIKSENVNIISFTSLHTGHFPFNNSGSNKNNVLQFQHMTFLYLFIIL